MQLFKLNANRTQKTRAQELKLFKARKLSKQKQESDFWTRGTFSANAVEKKIGFNLDEIEHPKKIIAEVLFNYFGNKYNLEGICSWRLTCL